MMIPSPSQGNPSPLSLSENDKNIFTTIFTRREKQNSPICFSDDENRILSEILYPLYPGQYIYPPSSVYRSSDLTIPPVNAHCGSLQERPSSPSLPVKKPSSASIMPSIILPPKLHLSPNSKSGNTASTGTRYLTRSTRPPRRKGHALST
mmetsp:Transcript_1984/g.4550  ORF Transcript_1984/g.4550 Transcript_1984/m.4550 type:complete len:150 (-) Transcript_1984:1840-2289(-)